VYSVPDRDYRVVHHRWTKSHVHATPGIDNGVTARARELPLWDSSTPIAPWRPRSREYITARLCRGESAIQAGEIGAIALATSESRRMRGPELRQHVVLLLDRHRLRRVISAARSRSRAVNRCSGQSRARLPEPFDNFASAGADLARLGAAAIGLYA